MDNTNHVKHPILKFNRNNYYPYIQLPRVVELHLSGPVLPPKPENITAPTLPQKPDEPSIPKAPRVVMEKLEAALAIGAGVATLVSIIMAGAPGFVITRGVITVVRLAKNAYDSYNYKNIDLPKYEKELSEYLAKFRNWEEQCHGLKIEHQQRIQEAELEYRKQVEIITEYWKEGKTSFPEKIEPHSLAKNRNPKRAKKGRNDDLLRSKLASKIFLVKHIEIELLPEDNVLYYPDSEYRYTPDIAIQAKRDGKKLFIDIENDEPWYEENGRKYPTHEVDNRKHAKRDVFFVDRGWVVIRFSEQQVVTETDRCSDFILDVIQSIFQPSYLDIKLPKEHKRWSSDNALSVERPEARSYLNQVVDLSNSKIENSKHSSSSRQRTGLEQGITINNGNKSTSQKVSVSLQNTVDKKFQHPWFSFEVVTVNPQEQIVNRKQASVLYQTIDLGQAVTLDMVLIPGGAFTMGSPDREPDRSSDEGPQHQVTVAEFWMGKYPITQAQWRAVAAMPQVKIDLDPNPSYFKGDNRPVERMSWNDAVEFCDRLSQKLGQPYTLPSEAQWEYACRAGTTTPFHFGDTISPDLANYDGNYTYGSGPKGTYRKKTTEVNSFPPNGFGLYGMHGNVWEWCLDHFHDSYNGAPVDGSAWVTGGNSNFRMLRGGSWNSDPRRCRCAYRDYYNPVNRYTFNGFRVVSVPPRTWG